MAKGQKRSNRELKKPKKSAADKAKGAAPSPYGQPPAAPPKKGR
jgi:hypothetical protein